MKRKWLWAVISIALVFVCTFTTAVYFLVENSQKGDNNSITLPGGEGDPDNPGGSEDPDNPDNPGGSEDPDDPDNPGGGEDPDGDEENHAPDEIIDEGASRGLKYTLSDNGSSYLVTDIGTCTDTELVISSTYNGLPVTSIRDSAFDGCTEITGVTIPDSVTSIHYASFRGCTGLTSIDIPDYVTNIGTAAFEDCTGLTEISIPDSVTSISQRAFDNTAYYNQDSNWEQGVLYIGRHLIAANTTISGKYTVKEGTQIIAGGAFESCTALDQVILPDSVISISARAFYGCTDLSKITIPESVTFIGSWAFSNCTSLT